MLPPTETGEWLIFDGDCPMCRRSAHWFVRLDRQRNFTAAPFQNTPSPPMTDELRTACEQAFHVIRPDGSALRGAAAVAYFFMRVAPRWLRWIPRLLGRPPWVWPLEIVYKLIAANRMRIGRFVLTNEPRAPLEPFRHE